MNPLQPQISLRKHTILSTLLLTLVTLSTIVSNAQPIHFPAKKSLEPVPESRTYALVIGISKYFKTGIPSLQYADKDAEVFAAYLRSAPGGNVPDSNIIVLKNEEATTSAVINQIYNLKKLASENDVIYIYFSGHGDLENETMYNDGYLICYDSPKNNYVLQALSIDFLNKMTNTIAVENRAKVILITDACHSGKLTEENSRANFLVGEQLRKSEQNEVRITSSSSDQLSNEMQEWGGGRGVFSWYLVNGLNGMADTKNTGVVSLGDIDSYMHKSLANDKVLQSRNLVQTPVLTGKTDYVLAKVIPEVKQATAKTMSSSTAGAMSPDADAMSADAPETIMLNSSFNNEAAEAPDDHFFDALKNIDLAEVSKELSLTTRPVTEVPAALIQYLKSRNSIGKTQLTKLENLLKQGSYYSRFCNRLAGKFDETGQKIILAYLDGEDAELERRRYYNAKNNGYQIYADMFGMGSKLASPDHPLRNILRIKELYFSAVSDRLLVPVTDDAQPLIKKSLENVNKALQLEKYAAYLYNERGIIYLYKNDYSAAKKDFIEATKLSPEWAVPHANLMGIYVSENQFEDAVKERTLVLDIDSSLQCVYSKTGVMNHKQGNLLTAEENFMTAIRINGRPFFPFEYLGNLFLSRTEFAKADSFFYESDKRKKRDHYVFPRSVDADGVINLIDNDLQSPMCNFDTSKITPDDPIGNFIWALHSDMMVEMGATQYSPSAEKHYKMAIAADLHHPLAYHYLGIFHLRENNLAAAENDFIYAEKNFLNQEEFQLKFEKQIAQFSKNEDSNCITTLYKRYRYQDRDEDSYFLANVLERRTEYLGAARVYEKLVGQKVCTPAAYSKLSKMKELSGDYDGAEKALLSMYQNIPSVEGELYDFYERMNQKFPSSAIWFYKKGLYCNKLVQDDPSNYLYDTRSYSPFEKADMYLGTKSKFYDPVHDTIPGTREIVLLERFANSPYSNGINAFIAADSLFGRSNEHSADVCVKLGDMYSLQGIPRASIGWYQIAIDLLPKNAGVRKKLVICSNQAFKYQLAMEQLQYLHENKQASAENEIAYAHYTSLNGNYLLADSLFDYTQSILPFTNKEVVYNRAVNELLRGNDKKAIQLFASLEASDSNGIMSYNQARIYAQMNKQKQAFQQLENALKNGFNYQWVLEKDPMMAKLRKTNTWKNMIPERRNDVINFVQPY